MLMFSKISLKAFVYDIIDIFSFPDSQIQEIFVQKEIVKCYIYLILTDTDSCSLQFVFLSNLNCRISEDEARDLIFDIYIYIYIFFSIWVFFHEHSRITGLQGKGEGISFTPHYHFHPLERHLDISRVITAESSPLHIASSRARTGNLWSPVFANH